MENKYKFWIARDKRNELFLYKSKPKRVCNYEIWLSNLVCMGTISKNLFPDLKWENEPIEVELRSVITDIEAKAKKYASSITDKKELQEIIVNAFKAGYKV